MVLPVQRPGVPQLWHWRIQPPVLGGGGNLGGQLGAGSQPRVGTPKTDNSTDLTHYFCDGPKFIFENIKSILGAFKVAKSHDGPLPGFWGMAGLAPWIRQWVLVPGMPRHCWYPGARSWTSFGSDVRECRPTHLCVSACLGWCSASRRPSPVTALSPH